MAFFDVHSISKEFCAQSLWTRGSTPSWRSRRRPQMTEKPTVTGSSVIGFKYNHGVMVAADMLGCYSSLARFRDCERVFKVNSTTVVGCSGDYADFQFLRQHIEQKVREDECLEDGYNFQPMALYTWLTRVLYNRRSHFVPLLVHVVIGGLQGGKPFLATIDRLGMAFQDDQVAAGDGAYIALPSMRAACEQCPNMGDAQARILVNNHMRTLFYRDARASSRYQLAVVSPSGACVEGPYDLDSNWDIAYLI